MQRSHWLRGLALAVGLLVTQCFESISDDCTKTLTCEDDQQPTLREDCTWRYPNQQLWLGAPQYDATTKKWRWPDGRETLTQEFECNLPDAGTDAGPAGPDCRVNITCDEGQVCDAATGDCVQCAADIDCAGNMAMGDAGAALVCDTASHRCVECLGNQDCSGDTSVCKVDAANSRRNTCVECTDSTNCTDPDEPICDDRANDCTSRCQSAADCTGDKKACNTSLNICVECTANTNCTNADEPLCDTESNLCVECLDDTACASEGRTCDLESHTCVQCQVNEQCTESSRRFCETEVKECVQCLNDQHCTLGAASRCNTAHVCAGCTNDAQCEDGTHCRNGTCVECTSNPHCTDPSKPSCETGLGICVQCLNNSQCPEAGAARCETNLDLPIEQRYQCVGCVENEDCTGGGRNLPPLCDRQRSNGTCSECTVAFGAAECSEFGVERSACLNGSCSRCSVDTQCSLFSETPACNPDFGCVQCTESADCIDTPATPNCKLAAGGGPAAVNTCVECIDNGDCLTPGASLCQNNECVPCVADADCGLIDSNGATNGGTPLNVCDAGTCVECTGVKRAPCGEDVCNSLTKQCAEGRAFRGAAVCDECVSDFECATNARCVQQTFEGQAVGFFCFPLAAGTPAACAGPRIFLGATTTATIDQEQPTPTVCQPRRTTCAALDDLADAVACDNAADCGVPNVEDGICDPALDICTVPCSGGADCAGTCDLEAGACEP
jgi:hypothetical protein